MAIRPQGTLEQKRASKPLNYGKRQRDLTEAIHQRVVKTVQDRRRRMISDQNALVYRHGREWSSTPNPDAQEFSSFLKASAEATIPFEHIVEHRLNAISDYVNQMAEGLERCFMRHLIDLLNSSTNETGNVVRTSGHAAADFVEMLSKIETGVDRFGRPTTPSIVTSPETGERLLQEFEAQSHDFHLKVAELQAYKEKAAIAREATRISRFRW